MTGPTTAGLRSRGCIWSRAPQPRVETRGRPPARHGSSQSRHRSITIHGPWRTNGKRMPNGRGIAIPRLHVVACLAAAGGNPRPSTSQTRLLAIAPSVDYYPWTMAHQREANGPTTAGLRSRGCMWSRVPQPRVETRGRPPWLERELNRERWPLWGGCYGRRFGERMCCSCVTNVWKN